MLPFNPQGQARFSYQVDFSEEDFANISFYDRDRREILFHLSLRAGDGLAVCNRRGPGAEEWGRERPRRVAFGEEGTCVELLFQPPHVTVRLDGREVFHFGKEILRPRFPDLDRIGFADFQGGLVPRSIDIDIRDADADPRLALTQRFELRGALPLPAAGAPLPALQITAKGFDEPLPVIPTPDPHAEGGGLLRLRAILPGRVWETVPEDAALHLALHEAGVSAPLAEITVSRADIIRHAAALLRGGDLGRDALAAAQLIEHVRFAGILDRLDPDSRARLTGTVTSFGLEDFLWPAGDDDREAPAAAPAPPGSLPLPAADPDALALAAAQSDLAEALNAAGPDADLGPLLDAATAELPNRVKWDFYISFSDWFCLHDRFDTLFDHAYEAGTRDFRRSDTGWFNSGVLPFLFRQDDIAALREVMWELCEDTESWIQTASVAWVLKQALARPDMDERDLDDLIYAFTDFVDRRRWDYWGRTPCQALVQAAVALLAHSSHLADYAREHIDWFLPRAYGLSRQFWDMVAQRNLRLTPQLEAARQSWACIAGRIDASHPADDAGVNAALMFFDRMGCADVMRFRRELMGPTGLNGSDGTPPSYLDLAQAGLNPGEAAIRQLAFPGGQPAEPALTRTAADAVSLAYTQVPRAPFYALQLHCSRAAADILSRGRDPGIDALDSLARDLVLLSQARSEFIGFGIGLGLIRGLIEIGALESADHLRQTLESVYKTMSSEDRDRLASAPAMANPLFALRALDCDSEPGAALVRACLDSFAEAAALLPPQPAAPVAPGAAPSPLFDTLVVVFSCKPNLDTRIPAMRESWLGQLAAMGVPHVIVVGDGDGRIEGDVVHLDAPDDYEGLPQKTLAAIRWVHDNTTFTHLLKIDDDCFLNPGEFFHSQSYRKFDYYGRILTRQIGQTDRAWHCAKSSSARGRMELDKSPEPSTYCDGGSGYALSRRAMAAALDASASPEGQALIRVSFMEDKLLGDLLALREITPADEDYRISQRRRTHRNAIPVSIWVNGFDASRSSPVKLVHLDAHKSQAEAMRTLDSDRLTPKKIWPSYQDVQLGYQSNALELVSAPDRLDAAREAPVAVVACMRNEMFMLPHFLDHYRAQGVESFLIVDNCSDDGTLEYLADQPDVALFSVDTDYSLSNYGVAWQQALVASFRVDRWSLMADADELLVWEPTRRASLPELVASEEFAGAEAARIFMLDMYPRGPLAEADFKTATPFDQAGFVDRVPFRTNWAGHGPYDNQPTWTSALRHRLIPGSRAELFVAQKLALLRYRPWMRLSAGLHYVGDVRVAPRELLFAHFKYNADFRRKAMAEVARRQHFNDAEEYRKYLALVSEGRDVIFDPELSVPWEDCDFARARLAAG